MHCKLTTKSLVLLNYEHISRDVDGVLDSAKQCVVWSSNKFDKDNVEITIVENFQEKTLRKPNVMSDEGRSHQVVGNNAMDIWLLVINKIVNAIEK